MYPEEIILMEEKTIYIKKFISTLYNQKLETAQMPSGEECLVE